MTTATLAQHAADAELTARQARRELARRHFRPFVGHFPPAPRYQWGRHTVAIAEGLEAAHRGYRKGTSQFDVWCCPFRHGKSDLASRRFPIWHLGQCPDDEVILATYGFVLARKMSRDARRVFASSEYRRTFGLALDPAAHAAAEWQVDGHKGSFVAVGLEGAITGRGANVLVIDDYLKSREEAESDIVRDRTWDAFAHDLMTRRAPVSMVQIVANRWHDDDLVGRIIREMATNPDFPQFRIHAFPAWDDKLGWLFPERFSEEWYRSQQAALGVYGSASLLQQEPVPRTGKLFDVDAVQYYDGDAPGNLRWVRGWDLASTVKQRTKDDPDYTAGVKLAVQRVGGLEHLWIDDAVRGQWAAPERRRRMYATAERDGRGVHLVLETVAGYKDAAEFARHELRGRFTVRHVTPRDKLDVRAATLEPCFEAGNVHLRRGSWNAAFLAELRTYPGRHDDQVAGMVTAYEGAKRSRIMVETC